MRRCSGSENRGTSRREHRSIFRLEMLVVFWPKLRSNACIGSDENHQYKNLGCSFCLSARRTETNPPKLADHGNFGIQQHLPTKFQLFALETKMSPSTSSWSFLRTASAGRASKSSHSRTAWTFLVRIQTTEPSVPNGTTASGLNVIPRMNSASSPNCAGPGRVTATPPQAPSSPPESRPPAPPAALAPSAGQMH